MPVSSVGDLPRLQALVLRIFGQGDRPDGWFARKLRREWIDPDLSMVAVHTDGPATNPAAWCGYMLIGRPPSMGDAVRGAGSGVDPAVRGLGVGTAVLRAVAVRARSAGFARVRLHSERSTMGFYRDRGYELLRQTITAVGFARGPQASEPADSAPGLARPVVSAWDYAAAADQHDAVAWLPEAWSRTEGERLRHDEWQTPHGPVNVWCSREGTAWLVHRLTCSTAITLVQAADTVLSRLPLGAPVLVPDLTDDTPSTRSLLDAGWGAAQRGAMMQRSLGV